MEELFAVEGRPVYRGNVLFHPDVRHTGGRVTAEFSSEGEEVRVRADNGAVPIVKILELSWSVFPESVCRYCGRNIVK